MINSPNDYTQSDNGALLVLTSANKPLHLNNLNAATIPLSGKHLIEASAGTGKTYNITRIYLRLLLERQIPVEKILLMTFTLLNLNNALTLVRVNFYYNERFYF